MANSFQQVANNGYYVSKSGNDADTGSADAPIASFLTLRGKGMNPDVGSTQIIGTGQYNWFLRSQALVNGQFSAGWSQMNADGIVKINGRSEEMTYLASSRSRLQDFYFQQATGYNFGETGDINTYSYNAYTRCIFKVLPQYAASANSTTSNDLRFYDCIFFNVNLAPLVSAGGYPGNLSLVSFTRCIFINCVVQDSANVSFSYVDSTSSISTRAATNNNVDPRCLVANGFGLNVAAAGFSLASTRGISALPGFNAPVKEDFTLTAGSAHIANGIGPEHLRYANTFFMEFLGGTGELATLTNLRLAAASSAARVPLAEISMGANSFGVNNQGGVVLIPNSNGDGFATLTTNRIPFSDIPLEMTVMRLIAGLNFDTDFPGTEAQISLAAPHIFNNNVPDYSNGTSGSAGRNPNRLTYRMRWSTLTDPNINDPSNWVTGATFIEFAWNQKPLFNQATLIGNGDPSYNTASPSNVYARFYQLQVRLRNNYYSK
ncbi:hypothetical protein [Hymenobacter siberiensis]|uniref:hypothetical protein n=1 Tax=Hymenobacter siberiensis TaxID=2848396 RepID=UPI001C1E1123|nr:hypothetical protein [Hymenobacter siberiensis]